MQDSRDFQVPRLDYHFSPGGLEKCEELFGGSAGFSRCR